MIKVYFQSITGSHSELVAVFNDEKIYHDSLYALELIADRQRCIVTESVEDTTEIISALVDAHDEAELTMNIIDEEDSRQAWQEQIDNIQVAIDLLTELK